MSVLPLESLALGPFLIDISGFSVAAGLLGCVVLLRWRARRQGLQVRVAMDGLFAAVAGAWLVGRAADIALYRSDDWSAAAGWAKLQAGGVTSLGALLGAALGLAWQWRQSPERERYLDELALCVPAAWIPVRIGCFLGLHHAGARTAARFGVPYPDGLRHDLGLEEAAATAVLWAGLWLLQRRRPRTGTLWSAALAGYCTLRFGLEFLRGDDLERIGRHSDPRYLGWTLMQFVCLGVASTLALRAMLRSRRQAGQEPERTGPSGRGQQLPD